MKEEWGGWYVSSANERKEHVQSISLVEGGQPSFYAENIHFSSLTIFSNSPTPNPVSCRALEDPKRFRNLFLPPTPTRTSMARQIRAGATTAGRSATQKLKS